MIAKVPIDTPEISFICQRKSFYFPSLPNAALLQKTEFLIARIQNLRSSVGFPLKPIV